MAHSTPRQLVAGQPRQHLPVRGIDGDVSAAGDNVTALPADVFALHQKGDRLISGVQCTLNHLGTLGDEDALFRLQAGAQLPLCQAGKDIQLGQGCVSYLNDVGHKSLLA